MTKRWILFCLAALVGLLGACGGEETQPVVEGPALIMFYADY